MAFNPYKTIENVDAAYFTDGGDDKPVKELIVDIPITQDGTGTPSSENVRPIRGFTGMTIIHCGKNLFDFGSMTWVNNSRIDATGEVVINNVLKYTSNYFPAFPAGDYSATYDKHSTQNLGLTIALYDADQTWLQTMTAVAPTTSTGTVTGSFTIPEGVSFFRIGSLDKGATTLQIERGTEATSVVAYSGDSEDIGFGEDVTVYGGKLNVTTGDLMITHVCIASYAGETINKPWVSSIDEYDPDGTPSEGAQVVYPLTEPLIGKVTPTIIETILGINNIWASTGPIIKLIYIYHYIQLEREEDNMKSGYVMIDCGGLDLTGGSTPQTLSGLYARIKDAMGTGKLTLAENCINGSGVAISPLPVAAYNVSSTKAGLLFGTLLIEVTNEDSATVTDLTSAG